MLLNVFEADGFEIVDGGGEADGSGDIGRASLESGGWGFVGAAIEGDGEDHFTAAMPGGHGFE